MVVLGSCWQNMRKQEAMLFLWLDWFIRGCWGCWYSVKVKGWIRFRGVSMFWLLRRRDVSANKHAARCLIQVSH